MITKEIYKRQLHEKLDNLNEKISQLKEQADHAPDPNTKAEYNGRVEEIYALEQKLQKQLKKLENAEETAWEHLKEDIEIAWDKFESAVKFFIDIYK